MRSHLHPFDPERLEELRQLACLVARQPDLRLVEGPAGSGWSYAHRERRISMDGHRLRVQSWNFSKGLVLHECGHSAITRLHPLLRDPYLREPPIFALINVLEDCRLETWLQSRFPGSRPWITEYNDILLRLPYSPGGGREVRDHHRLPCFISAVLNRWWFRDAGVAANEQIRALTDRVWPHLEAICEAYPRGESSLEAIREAFAKHPMSSVYDEMPLPPEREAWELETRLCQLRMWDEFTTAFLPILHGFEPPGRSIIYGRQIQQWLERWLGRAHLGPEPSAFGRPGIRVEIPGSRVVGRPDGGWSPPAMQEPDPDLWPSDLQAYRTCQQEQALLIERLGDEVLGLLHPRIDRAWIGPRHSGMRLDLRAAARADADPERMDQVWERRQPPTHNDASITLLLDISSSMRGERIEATLWATVLLAEVCRRVGIPLAIFTFSNECHPLLEVDEPLDEAMQGRIGGLPQAAAGGTLLASALSKVHRQVLDLGTTDPFVVVLSDGIPSDDEDPGARVSEMERDGITVLGLGLGPDSENLARILLHCQTHLQAHDISEAFIRILIQASQTSPRWPGCTSPPSSQASGGSTR